ADEHTGLAAYRAVRGGAERFLGRAPAWAGAVAEEEPLRAAIEEKRLLRTDTAALHSLARLGTQDPATARLRVTCRNGHTWQTKRRSSGKRAARAMPMRASAWSRTTSRWCTTSRGRSSVRSAMRSSCRTLSAPERWGSCRRSRHS